MIEGMMRAATNASTMTTAAPATSAQRREGVETGAIPVVSGARSAPAYSAAVANRSAGAFASDFAIAAAVACGTLGRTDVTRGGVVERCWCVRLSAVAPANG